MPADLSRASGAEEYPRARTRENRKYLARQRGARWEEGSPAPCARYVCDLHENARRCYRSIEPEGPNELTRLNLFEQVTRRAHTAGNVPRESPGLPRDPLNNLAVLGQLVPAERPFSASLTLDRPRPRVGRPGHWERVVTTFY